MQEEEIDEIREIKKRIREFHLYLWNNPSLGKYDKKPKNKNFRQTKEKVEESYVGFDDDYNRLDVRQKHKSFVSRQNARGRTNRKYQREEILKYVPPFIPDTVETFDDYLRQLKKFALMNKEDPPAIEIPTFEEKSRRRLNEGSYFNWTVIEDKLPSLHRYFYIFL